MDKPNRYEFGGFEVTPVTILRLLSELEGSYALLKYMGFKEDMDLIDSIKQRYYKLYFKLDKEDRLRSSAG